MEKQTVEIPRARFCILHCIIKGQTPLLMNKFDDGIFDELDKKYSNKKEKVSIEQECENKTHYIDKDLGVVGFPASGIKKALSAYVRGLKMTNTFPGTTIDRGLRVLGENGELVRINYSKKLCNRMTGSNQKGNAIITNRPEFRDWSAELKIQYNPDIITKEQIMAILNPAGISIGIGSYRPVNNGNYGTFLVDDSSYKIEELNL
jgi:hypothetical protein